MQLTGGEGRSRHWGSALRRARAALLDKCGTISPGKEADAVIAGAIRKRRGGKMNYSLDILS